MSMGCHVNFNNFWQYCYATVYHQNCHKALQLFSSVDWGKTCSKILNSFQLLKQILEGRAECSDERIAIYDPPYSIEILKNEGLVVFRTDSEELAVLSENGIDVKGADDGDLEVLKDWCIALTALSFRRYVARKN